MMGNFRHRVLMRHLFHRKSAVKRLTNDSCRKPPIVCSVSTCWISQMFAFRIIIPKRFPPGDPSLSAKIKVLDHQLPPHLPDLSISSGRWGADGKKFSFLLSFRSIRTSFRELQNRRLSSIPINRIFSIPWSCI